jgi:Uncharacterized conserved protein (COG2071)
VITHAIDCTIERRLLVNYRIEPGRVARLLPQPFRPQLKEGWAVGGVCLLRLGQLRVPRVPRALGTRTENVAHRFAVQWDDGDGTHVGVYVPRRDTDSRLAAWAGGKVFPGSYQRALFNVHEVGSALNVRAVSRDGQMYVDVTAREADHLESELFGTVDDALDFFRRGSLGYSPSSTGSNEGVRLESTRWEGHAVTVDQMRSSLFDDRDLFPVASCVLDSGIVMRNLPVRWVAGGKLSPVGVAGRDDKPRPWPPEAFVGASAPL